MKRLAISVLLASALATPLTAHAQSSPAPATSERNFNEADTEDVALERRIQGALTHAFPSARLDTSVRFGIVTLEGKVSSAERASNIEALVSKLDGVVYVSSRLTTPTEISERVTPAIEQLRAIGAKTVAALPLVAIALGFLLVTLALARAIRDARWPYRSLEARPLMRELARQAASTLTILLGLLFVFELLDVTAFVGAVLGTAGIAGLAVGFAFKDIVENYLSSVMLSVQQPFEKGDAITIGGHTGKVIRMTMRDTVLMTFDGNHVRLPNSHVFKSALTNYSRNPLRRFDFTIGVGNGESLLDARRLGIEMIESVEGVLHDPAPYMIIDELGDSSVVCTFYAWVDQRDTDRGATRSEAIRRVKLRLEREGFDLPEPIYRLNITQTIATDSTPPPEPRSAGEPLEDASLQAARPEEEAIEQQIRDEGDDEKNIL